MLLVIIFPFRLSHILPHPWLTRCTTKVKCTLYTALHCLMFLMMLNGLYGGYARAWVRDVSFVSRTLEQKLSMDLHPQQSVITCVHCTQKSLFFQH
jgi:hypothetical protein